MEALDALIDVLESANRSMAVALQRAETLRRLRAEGRTYAEAVDEENRPLVVEVMRELVADLTAAAGRFQRAEARALWDEGMTMDRIATVFGITRQRVSGLLGSPGRRR